MRLEGVALDLGAGFAQGHKRAVGLGRAGVAAAGLDLVLHVQHTFFRNADQSAGLLDAGEHILDDRAALIHNQRRGNVVGFKPIYNVYRAQAVDFLAAAECKVDILRGGVALANQFVSSGQHAVKSNFRVQRTAAPEHAIFQHALKRRLLPACLVNVDDVIVSHQYGRLGVLLAGPGEQQATVLKALKLAGLENVGVECRQGIDELFKLGIVFQRVVRVGDGTAADEGAQIFHGLVTVDGFLTLGHSGGSARRKAGRAHQHHGGQHDDSRQNQP